MAPSTQPLPDSQPKPGPDTTPSALALVMIASMRIQAANHNALVRASKMGNLWFVNEANIVAAEAWTRTTTSGSPEDFWALHEPFDEVPYVYIPPAPDVPQPTIRILSNQEVEIGTGIYAGQVIGQPMPPVGTKVTQDGHTYMLIQTGRSLMGPSYGWQRIA